MMIEEGSHLKLTDLIEAETLRELQETLFQATGISISIRDLEGELIIPDSNPEHTRRFCAGMMRGNAAGRERCRQSDLEGGRRAVESGRPAVYTCHAGLTDFAVPIIVEGELIAYFFGGATLTEEPDLDWHRRYALELGFTPDEYVQLIEKKPIIPRERVEATAQLAYLLGNQLADMARQRLAAEERAEAMTILARELSSPVIPVFEGIIVLPLIGSIDTGRAQQIMTNLLNGTVAHRARVVIIDITGVPTVDSSVANHLLRAIQAVRLLGAETILVGITPEVAQTIVHLGVDLSEIATRSNLQDGLMYALRTMHMRIVPLEQPDAKSGVIK